MILPSPGSRGPPPARGPVKTLHLVRWRYLQESDEDHFIFGNRLPEEN